MLFKPVCLCLMLLNTHFFISTSSHQIICYIHERKIRRPYDQSQSYRSYLEFWENLPRDICTRFILIVTRFEDAADNIQNFNMAILKMGNNHQNKNELGIIVDDEPEAREVFSKALPLVRNKFNGLNVIWLESLKFPSFTREETKKLEFMHHVRHNTCCRTTLSQAVVCDPSFPDVIRPTKLLKDNEYLTIVHVVFTFAHATTWFLFNPEKCVTPLVNYGIPLNRIAIGLNEKDSKFKDVCKDEIKKRRILSISQRISCMVKFKRMAGVMVWSLESDDYEGRVCGMGKYPFLQSYKDQLQSCAVYESTNPFAGAVTGAGVVVRPVIVMSRINIVVLTLLFRGFYSLFY